MKIHKLLVDAAAEACFSILEENNHASYVLPQTLAKDKRWGARDRRFLAEILLFTLKNYRFLCYLSNQKWEKKKNFQSIIAHAIYLEYKEIPDYLAPVIDTDSIQKLLADKKIETKVKYSFADWTDTLLSSDLGKVKWQKEAEASNQKALTYLRVNQTKSTLEKCLEELQSAGVDCAPTKDLDNCIQLNSRADIRQLNMYKDGEIEVQDAGSQMIGSFLSPNPNERVIDACAGAGGKSLHMADLMKNLGKIVSMDVEAPKLKELAKRAIRNGFSNIKTHVHEEKTSIKYANWADKMLLDVPCSGLGVLKRNPDDKWKLSEERMAQLMEIQEQILAEYSKMLKIGGTLVYATCSIYSGENQKQVEKFLAQNKNFTFVEEKQLFPSDGFDGFYMAKMIRQS